MEMSRSGASEPLLHAHGSVSEEERHAEARESDALLSPRSPSAFARLRLSDTDLVSGLTHREAAHRLNHFGPNEQTRRPRSGASEEFFFRSRGAGEIGKRDKSASLLDACPSFALFSNDSKVPPDWATRACLVAVAAATVQMLFVLSAYVDADASGTSTSADDLRNKYAIKNARVDLVAAVVLLVTHVTTVTIYVRRATETTKTTRASYVSVTRRARVVRDGKTRLVDHRELAPGDVVVVKKGDVAPADILLSAQSDETVLVSVSADGTDLANVIRSGDVLPRGAEVRAGEARGIVARTGDFSGDFSVFGSTRVDDVTRGYSRDDDFAIRRFRLRSAYATASCASVCVLIGAVTFARSGSEKLAETDDEEGFGFFGAVAFATALVVATAPVSSRATRSAVRAATAAESRRACRGSVAAFASASGEKDDRWLRLAAAETVLLDESALLKDDGKHVVREIRVASGLASSLVGPRDVLTCAALASRFNAEVSGPTDGVRRGFSDAADAAVADALGGTETLSQTYVIVSRGRFRASSSQKRAFSLLRDSRDGDGDGQSVRAEQDSDEDEDEDEDAVECLVERLADGSRFRARRGAPSATLASCGADPETAEEMLAAAAACERAGLRCLLVAAHHGAPPSGNPPAKREDKSSSEEARQELARDDNLFFADERAESNKDASNVAASEDSSEDSGWTVLGLVAFEVPYRRDARETLARLNSLGTSVVLLTRGEAATPRAALASTRSDDDESSSSHRECSDEPVFFSTLSLEEARDETSPFRRSFFTVDEDGDGVADDAFFARHSNVAWIYPRATDRSVSRLTRLLLRRADRPGERTTRHDAHGAQKNVPTCVVCLGADGAYASSAARIAHVSVLVDGSVRSYGDNFRDGNANRRACAPLRVLDASDALTETPGVSGVVALLVESRVAFARVIAVDRFRLSVSLFLLAFHGAVACVANPGRFNEQWPSVARYSTAAVVYDATCAYVIAVALALEKPPPARFPVRDGDETTACVAESVAVAAVAALGSVAFLAAAMRGGGASEGFFDAFARNQFFRDLAFRGDDSKFGRVLSASWLQTTLSMCFAALSARASLSRDEKRFDLFSLFQVERDSSALVAALFGVAGGTTALALFILRDGSETSSDTFSSCRMTSLRPGHACAAWAWAFASFVVGDVVRAKTRDALRRSRWIAGAEFSGGRSGGVRRDENAYSVDVARRDRRSERDEEAALSFSRSVRHHLPSCLSWTELARVRGDARAALDDDGAEGAAAATRRMKTRRRRKKSSTAREDAVARRKKKTDEDENENEDDSRFLSFRAAALPLTPATLSLLAVAPREGRDANDAASADDKFGFAALELKRRREENGSGSDDFGDDHVGRWVATQAERARAEGGSFSHSSSGDSSSGDEPEPETTEDARDLDASSEPRRVSSSCADEKKSQERDAKLDPAAAAAAAAEALVPYSHRLRRSSGFLRASHASRADVVSALDWHDCLARMRADAVADGRGAIRALDVGCGAGGFARAFFEARLETVSDGPPTLETRERDAATHAVLDLCDPSPSALRRAARFVPSPFALGKLRCCATLAELARGKKTGGGGESPTRRYDVVFAVHALHATAPGVAAGETSLASFLRSIRSLLKPHGFATIVAPYSDSHEARFHAMYRETFLASGSPFRCARNAVESRAALSFGDEDKNAPKSLTVAEHVVSALAARGVAFRKVDRAFSVTVPFPFDRKDEKNTSVCLLESYLHGCAGNDSARLETMLQHPKLGAYLNSCRSRDGKTFRFPMKTAHITIAGAGVS